MVAELRVSNGRYRLVIEVPEPLPFNQLKMLVTLSPSGSDVIPDVQVMSSSSLDPVRVGVPVFGGRESIIWVSKVKVLPEDTPSNAVTLTAIQSPGPK